MRIRHLLLLVACMLVGVQGIWADNITPEIAKQKASAFLQQRFSAMKSTRNVKKAPAAEQLQNVAVDAENLYVFNLGADNGFVIMANDDSYDNVLGYCDRGSFDSNDMPDALRDIIEVYNYNVGMAKKNPSMQARAPRKAPADLAPVKPLTRTYYNQSGPEGMYLPIVADESGYRRVAPSGCVACATAQVIAYYQWPNTVKGTNGYTMTQTVADNNINSPEELCVYTADSKTVKGLPSYDINWDNIYQGSYNDDYSGAQTSATFNYARNYSGDRLAKMQEIGRLFLYVCNTLPMTYFGTSGTGAVSANLASILPRYWGYKNQIKVNQRRNYTKEQWINLLYEELSHQRLVVYAGTAEKDDGSTGAHTFILDGYDGAGYWHVNWGWNGRCDGYFDFDNLLPFGLPDDTDGYTVSRNGYVLRQHAITGIEPDRDGTATTNNGYLTAAYSETKNSFTSGGTTYGKTMIVYYENPNPTITTNQVSWALLNDDGTINNTYYGTYRTVIMPKYDREDYASNEDSVYVNATIGTRTRMFFAPLDRVVSKFKLTKPGTYTIVPICRKEGDTNFEDFRICEGADKYYFTVTIDADGKASVTAHPQIKLSLQEIKLVGDQIVSDQYNSRTQEIQVLVRNDSPDEFAGMVRLSFTDVPEGAEKPAMRTASANILPGETCKVKFPILLYTVGEYTVKPNYMYRKGVYTPFSDTFTFEMTNSSGKSANISTSFNMSNVDDVDHIGNRYYLKSNSLVGTYKVTNSGTASAYRCTYVQLYNSTSTDKASLVASARIDGQVAPGYTIDLPFHFNNIDLSPGKVYYLRASCTSSDNGYASGGSTYQVMAAPSLTYWNNDGEETSMYIEPDYTTSSSWLSTSEYYTYNVAIPSDAVAVDMAKAVDVMKNTSSSRVYDQYNFTPATNPNCLYFLDVQPTTEVSNKLANKNVVIGNVASQIKLADGYDFYTPTEFTASNISYSRKFDVGNKRKVGGGWQSMVLPFEVTSIEVDGATKKWFKNAKDDADFWVYQYMGDKSLGYGAYDVVFSYLDSETMQAHTPYIMAVPDASWGAAYSLVGKTLVFKATDATVAPSSNLSLAGDYYSFVGTYKGQTELPGIYVLNANGTSFNTSSSVSPFNAYLYSGNQANAPAQINIVFFDNEETAIGDARFGQIDDQTTAYPVYDLQGRQVSNKGLQSLPKGLYIINGKKIVK